MSSPESSQNICSTSISAAIYSSKIEHSSLQTQKLLVVEDNAINQKIILKQLNQLGYSVDVVANGQEAIEAIAHTAYNTILMDCQMPVMDGYIATQHIRTAEQLGDYRCTIIAMTAAESEEERQRAIDAGMDDFLSKPVTKDQLGEMLRKWGNYSAMPQPTLQPTLETCSPIAPEKVMHFDRQRLLDIADGCLEFADKLLRMFIDDSYNHLTQLKVAMAAHDAANIGAIAHHIRGAAANVGAQMMQTVAARIEQQVQQSNLEDMTPLIAVLEACLFEIASTSLTD